MTPLPRPFDLVIFDCDGVIVDSEVISCGVLAAILSPLDPDYDLNGVMRRFLGRPSTAVIEEYERLSGPAPEGFVRDWRRLLFERFAAGLRPVEGVRAAVEGIACDYCLASSSDEERIEFCLRTTGLWDLFSDRVFSTTRVARGKPAPDLFLLAARERAAAPGRCLVIEDSVSGVQAGKAAGMTVFGLTAGSHFAILDQREALVEAGADRIIGAWRDLAMAHAS